MINRRIHRRESIVFPLIAIFSNATVIFAATPPADLNAVRVAIMPFTVDDNSHRSSIAASDLGVLVQAELSSDPGIQWVERAELKAAELELELSELGFADAASALRRGRFTAADWLVTGAFAASTNGTWSMYMEVIDVKRADLLSSITGKVSRATHPTLQSALPQVAMVTSCIRTALKSARQRWDTIRGRRTLAVLMLLNADEAETTVAEAIEKGTGGAWRVSRFGRAGQVFAENEMILLGLVEQSPEAWEKLADAYAWGRLALHSRQQPGFLPVLEVTFWDGTSDPRIVSINGQRTASLNAALDQASHLGSLLADELAPLLTTRSEVKAADNVRAQLAQSLANRAKTWRQSPENWCRWRVNNSLSVTNKHGKVVQGVDMWVREEVGQQMRLLEAACLFDPNNQEAYEQVLHLRFAPYYELSGLNRFWSVAKESESWGHYVDRFGLSSAGDAKRPPDEYMVSPYRLMSEAQYGNKEDFGFPRDVGGATVRRWRAGFAKELANRAVRTASLDVTRSMARGILSEGLQYGEPPLMLIDAKLRRQCIESLWPPFIESLPAGSRVQDFPELCASVKATYAELGLAGKETVLLQQLNKPKKLEAKAPIKLPKAADIDKFPRFTPPPTPPR